MYSYIHLVCIHILCYGVALIRRTNKIIVLSCKTALLKRRYSAQETYDLIDPTDRSHPIRISIQATPHVPVVMCVLCA